jgi:O-succinylhomoserine sulfhydrylase
MTKGLETLDLRVRRMGESALTIGRTLQEWGEQGRGITRVVHPFLPGHPQHELALRQMDGGGGTVVTFDVEGGKRAAFALVDALGLIDISNNLGDAKSLTTHPATTTHRRLTPEARAAVGITDGTIRVSVGLEDVRDLLADLDQALAAAERART